MVASVALSPSGRPAVPPAASVLRASGPASVWAPAVVARSAFRAGALAGVVLRPSSRAWSGRVLVCVFRSLPAALAFSARWGARCGVPCFVRPGPRAGLFAVSVPVVAGPVPSVVSSGAAVAAGGLAWSLAGGVRRAAAVAAALAA